MKIFGIFKRMADKLSYRIDQINFYLNNNYDANPSRYVENLKNSNYGRKLEQKLTDCDKVIECTPKYDSNQTSTPKILFVSPQGETYGPLTA
jgi:hypothetical protein